MEKLFKEMQEDVLKTGELSDDFFSKLYDVVYKTMEDRKVEVYLSVGDEEDERIKDLGTFNIFDIEELVIDSDFYPRDFKITFEEVIK